MDLEALTLEGLDWPALRDALAEGARTPMGADAIRAAVPFDDIASIEEMYDAIAELRALEDDRAWLPVGGVVDARLDARRASRGEVLDPPALIRGGQALEALHLLERVLQRHGDEIPTLARWGSGIADSPDVRESLADAFDAAGALSATRFPLLSELRQRITALHTEIRGTLDRLVHGDTFGDLLQDRFWTLRENRYVLPIKAHAKRMDHGIVHGTSGSGRTVFVEPHVVIALNNRLRLAEGELTAEEYRIRAALSRELGTASAVIDAGVEGAIRLDQACARSALGARLDSHRPIIGEEGVVALRSARHPLLALRGVAVVANDLDLRPAQPALVISGPNAGGKTVALKTIGLCAQLVRHGCLVPAADGSRVDRFASIVAIIGDQQTVAEDLSSFSAHLVLLRATLDGAGPGSLVLLDEIAAGTDPAQGAALGQAILEALVDRGARVVVTTHFGPLKRLGSVDPRFVSAAMQYHEGRPTWRVIRGVTGESHALGIAARVGLDGALLARAATLVGEGERSVSATIEQLEAERSRLQSAADEAERLTAGLAEREAAVAGREAEIAERGRRLEFDAARVFLQRVRAAERAIEAIVTRLEDAPDAREAELAKTSVRAFRGIVPARPAPEIEGPPPDFAVGDRVRLREYDLVGEIVSVGDGGLRVRAGAITVNTKPEQVERA
jgi:DNA mismatch repair protein MutS2